MKRVYIDMDGVLCDFQSAFVRDKKAFPEVPYPQSRQGFYLALELIPQAIETMEWLLKAEGIDPYILTAPSIYNPLSYTEKRLWVENHLGFEWVQRLIISPDKSLLKGHILIDDHVTGRGQDKFEGLLLHFGSPEHPNWEAVIQTLQSMLTTSSV